MRPRLIIAALTGIIVGLSGIAFFLAGQLRDTRLQLEAAILPPPDLPLGSNPRPARLRLQDLAPIHIRTPAPPFHWREIESEDYAVYIANLRRIGCPESTLRDIILADIDQLFADRLHALEPEPADWEYWHHPDENPQQRASDRSRDDAYASLERERRQLIRNLLGDAAVRVEFDQFTSEAMRDRDLQFLTPEKRQAVAQALARWRLAQEDISFLAEPEAREERELAEQAALRSALATTLSPEELEQYELRSSPLAEDLRERLRGFSASREEFETLFRLERAFALEQQQLLEVIDTDPQAALRLEAAEIEFHNRIRDSLPPQRLTDFQRSLDNDFQTLFSLALDHSVPPTVANDVWDMRRTVEDQSRIVRDNPLLTPEQKERALLAIRSETQAAIVDVLGEPLLEAYQQEGGGWLMDLTHFDPPPSDLLDPQDPAPEDTLVFPPLHDLPPGPVPVP